MTICKQVSFFFNNLEGFKITFAKYLACLCLFKSYLPLLQAGFFFSEGIDIWNSAILENVASVTSLHT